MLANFVLVGMLLAISAQPRSRESARRFGKPVRSVSIVVAALFCAVIARAAYLQVWKSDDVAIAGTMVRQQDGVRRLQYNPRLLSVARQFGRGSILDRNGIPLATSNWDELVQHRAHYLELGIDIEKACNRADSRYYPLGGLTFHLLGDIRNRANWLATNTAYLERDMELALRGFSESEAGVDADPAATERDSKALGYHNYRVLLPLLRNRYQPDHRSVRRLREMDRTVRLTVDARLAVRAAEILQRHLRAANKERGAVVVLDAASGAVLALINAPAPMGANPRAQVDPVAEGQYFDRARFGLYPPGSVFKLVTAAAALRMDPKAVDAAYACRRLPDRRVGAVVRGWTVRDDITDKEPHGLISLPTALAQSCNAYFAQLAVDWVGAPRLFETAKMLGLRVGNPNTPERLERFLLQAGYGQGEVLVSPLQIARLVAAIANGGIVPNIHFVTGRQEPSRQQPQFLSTESAAILGEAMRLVVTTGTGSKAMAAPQPIAGKTGTAEVTGAQSHAWFAGFVPADTAARRIAFTVFIENGQYGGSVAAPVAADVVAALVNSSASR
jgi:cell division protein FtsI/penicillin-binding protein 2